MKQYLHTTILAVLSFTFIHANAASKLTINTAMPTAMKVVIDGKKFYSQDNFLSIRSLKPGYHTISIYYIKNGRDLNGFFDNGYNTYWKRAVSKQVVVRNNYQYDITINRFGRAFFDQDVCFNSNNNNWNRDSDIEDDDFENDDLHLNNIFEFDNGFDETYNDVDFFKKDRKHFNNGNNNSSNSNVMSSRVFDQIKQTMQNQNFESSKLTFAKQSVDNKSLSTKQIIELIDELEMESSKLEFAKHAYKSVYDKERYFSVINSFAMQSSKDDLMKYINKR